MTNNQTDRPRPPGPESRRFDNNDKNNRNRWGPIPSWAWIVLIVALLLNWLVAPILFPEGKGAVSIPYTSFKQQLENNNVAEVTTQADKITGEFKQAVKVPGVDQPVKRFVTHIPAFGDDQLMSQLDQKGVIVNVQPESSTRSLLLSILISFGPTILFFLLFLWLISKAQSSQQGLFGLGKSRAKRYNATESTRVTFDDVAGIEEAKQELAEIVDFLKNPQKYQRLGGTIPKGVLLIGPPGTGKTLLARAVAGEAGVPFFSMSGSEFVEMIVGVGAARVRELFQQAKKEAPCIIFVDELDAIGRRRGSSINVGGHDEREQTLNQLLVEMDGFDSRQGVIVLAATNRPDVLDPALLRPGRFDRRVVVQRPDKVGRLKILQVHTRNVPLDPNLDLSEIAAATPGLVGADLRNLVNEAALLAARRGKNYVDREDFFDALEKITLGAERKLLISEEDRRRVAYHESGHALLGLLLPEADPVHKVTIIPRGQALGVTYQTPEDDRYNYTERYLRSRITAALGGRAAEELVFGTVTTGAENDLKQVTEIARQMVTRWGMSKEVGLVYLSPDGQEDFLGPNPITSREYSESLATVIDRETRRIIDECYAEALSLLNRERQRLDNLAEALLREESLDEQQIREIVGLGEKQPEPA
ncbi:ATP-dependent metalloprotease FtsH [Thermobaculum terrenum ATCC BAA-798]|uniref:ATP-dependent zinc metalloprotease FtsH n=1 Tax=Thermobaculum terrenum (strain ATCC BAA-798 / CCMEE 7001 / YNP1) TaxID=525904 RepID=FTSH_THET1|nr:ATP-dependent zinc metalloprotease FtsH [Thermobaculum terrenum]D1CDT8.1 RecName: Full=ATP-dependent zinc metalloprotease FtsH [Thermobaculum terrenum ATCC BAA-798]ACZ41094.1 ATP-dependent metalloprotease FtsH [Thermobaculum terrenum ATCC BAA-798]